MKTPELITDPAAWQARCLADRDGGARIALVPTMGYLHDGHVSLLREARRRAGPGGLARATIFGNPTQFGAGEAIRGAIAAYADEVRAATFPDDAHSFHSSAVRLVPVQQHDDEHDEEPSGGVMGAPV